MIGVRARAAFCAMAAAALWLAPMVGVYAQALPVKDTEYCYGDKCYSKLSQAEAVMRAAHPLYGKDLKYKYSKSETPPPSLPGTRLKLTRRHYGVDDRKPPLINPAVYAPNFTSNPAPEFCAPANDPVYGNYCASESALIQGIKLSYQNAHGASSTVETEEPTGTYFEPFAISGPQGGTKGGLRLNHDNNQAQQRMLTVKIFNAQGVQKWGFQHRLYKFVSFNCPAGYTAKNGSNPAYDPATTAPVHPMKLCEANVDAVITERMRQQCPRTPNVPKQEGGNPCFPATGDKARFETDFEFAGRPFIRSYHSLRQVGQLPELAPGWTHSYSDRVVGSPYASELALITDSGYYETFSRIGNTPRFVSPETAGIVVDLVVENGVYVFKLSDGSSLVRYYRDDGRLLRIESKSSLWGLSFAYEGPRLISATDLSGRQIRFGYLENALDTIQLPDGRSVGYTYDVDGNLQSVRYTDNTTRAYHYNESGLSDANDPHALTGVSDNGQRKLTFAYDDYNRTRLSQMETVDGPVGKTTLIYAGDDQVTVTGHHGETRNYELSGDSGFRRVTALAAAGSGTVNNTYTGALVTESRDKRNAITRYEYTADGAYANARIEAYGTPDERKIVTMRNMDYRVTSIATYAKFNGAYVMKVQSTYAYNSRGQLLTRIDTDPATNLSRMSAIVYCEPSDVIEGSCPKVGLVKSVNGPLDGDADTTTYTYRMADDSACVSAPTTCAYRKGDVWKVTNALSQSREIVRVDGAARVRKTRDVNGVVTDFDYDARGRLTSRKTRGADDASEADDQIVRILYTPEGLLQRVTQPDGTFTIYSYDDAYRLIGISDNVGNQIDYTLNAAGDRLQEDTKDPAGALRRTISHAYNILGELQAQTDAYDHTTNYTYDAGGNLDQIIDDLGRVSDNTYDPLNRLTRSLEDMGGIAAETRFEYDALDNLVKVTDPNGLNTIYTYNGLGDLKQLQSPDTGITTYSYDSAGRRSGQTDARGVQVQYGHDALNRRTTVTYPSDSSLNVTYQYDTAQSDCIAGEIFQIGQLSKMTDGSGSTTYCYDRFGQLTRKTQRTQGKTFVVRWQYAVSGRLQATTYPDGSVVDYVYDANGRLTELGVTIAGQPRQRVIRDIAYHPFGPAARWKYGIDRMLVRTLNQNGQPGIVQAQNLSEAPIDGLSLGYEFDEVGNLKKLRDGNQADPPARIYGYDRLNRLTEAKDASNLVWQSYSYDKTGNRMSSGQRTVGATQDCTGLPPGTACTPGAPITQWSAGSYTYVPGSHRLSTLKGMQRSYDSAGNLTVNAPMGVVGIDPPPGGETESASYGGTEQSADEGGETAPPGVVARAFSYNAANRLSATSLGGEHLMSYGYNGRGERVYRHGSDKTVYTVFDSAGHWMGDYDANGVVIQQAIWFDGMPVGLLAKVDGATRLFYVEPDALGSPRTVIDPTRGALGTPVWRWNLAGEPFADDAPNEDPDGDDTRFVLDMRFPGQQYDSASGLNYNYFRDYEAATGRYVESDSIGLFGGNGTYLYVQNQPYTAVDRFGLQEGPGWRDQINPSGLRPPSEENYTEWFSDRFPNTIMRGKLVFRQRIKQKACALASSQPKAMPALDRGADDIDISDPSMSRFGDEPQGFYERRVAIGEFELKTTGISLSWESPQAGCRCFSYSTGMYVAENTGENLIRGIAAERRVIMGRWALNGRACCDN